MAQNDDSVDSLRERLHKIEAELAKRNEHVARLEKVNKELSARVQDASESSQGPGELSEMEETLRRMMTRIAMILQGSKCMFLIHDSLNEEVVWRYARFGL